MAAPGGRVASTTSSYAVGKVISLGSGWLSMPLSTAVGPSNQGWGNRECPLHVSPAVFCRASLPEHGRSDWQLGIAGAYKSASVHLLRE